MGARIAVTAIGSEGDVRPFVALAAHQRASSRSRRTSAPFAGATGALASDSV